MILALDNPYRHMWKHSFILGIIIRWVLKDYKKPAEADAKPTKNT